MLFAFAELSNLASKYKTLLYWLSFFILMLLAGLRYETGGDWPNYTAMFNNIEPFQELLQGNDEIFQAQGVEVGYKLLCSICKIVSDNVQFLFFIIALFISTSLFRIIPCYSPLPQMSILVYFGILYFSLDMNVLRQGIAVMIMFYAYRYIESKNFWSLFCVAVFASLFHSSALIMIPVYFLLKRTYSNKTLIVLFIIFNAILFLQIKWLSPILELLLGYALDPVIAARITTYLTNEAYAVGRGITFGSVVNVLLFVLLIMNRKRLLTYQYFNLFLNLFMMYLFIYCCMSELVEVGNRLKFYFMMSFTVLLPMLADSLKIRSNKVIVYLGICAFSFMYARDVLLDRPNGIAFNPYQNYIIYSITNKPSDGLERLRKNDEELLKSRGQ